MNHFFLKKMAYSTAKTTIALTQGGWSSSQGLRLRSQVRNLSSSINFFGVNPYRAFMALVGTPASERWD